MGHFPQSLNCKARKSDIRTIGEKKENIIRNSYTKFINTLNNGNKQSETRISSITKRYPQALPAAPSFTLIPNSSDMEHICQLDGNDDFSSELEDKPCKSIFSVSCEVKQVINLINFFRSFNVLWISTTTHTLCSLNQNCFFCNIRSSCLRLRQERRTGPRCLKVNEFTCQLNQYGPNWRIIASNLKAS